MKSRLAALLITLVAAAAHAQPLSTAFTYQGRLDASGSPAGGTYDFRFTLFDAPSAGTQLGPVLCVNNLAVTNGVFTVQLDFGSQFAGQQRFLEVWVRADTGLDCSTNAGFTTLSPRQNLTASPNAVYSLSAGSASTAGTATNATQLNSQPASFYTNAANLSVGTLPDSRLSTNVDLVNTTQTIGAVKNFAVAPAFTALSGPPFTIPSTAGLVVNLNADLLDGLNSTDFVQLGGTQTIAGTKSFASPPAFTASSGAPFTVASTTGLVANLNADLLDGLHGSDLVQIGGTQTVAGAKTFLAPITGASLVFTSGSTPLITAGQNNVIDKRMWIAHSESLNNWGIQYRDLATDGFAQDSIELVGGVQTRPQFGFVLSTRAFNGYDPMGATTIALNATTGAAQFNGGVSQNYAGLPGRATPVAFGAVSAGGASTAASPNIASSWDAANTRYEITITAENYTSGNYIAVVTSANAGAPVIASTDSVNGHLLVYFSNLAGSHVQAPFSFVVYKP
jgi:hypothetical protein